MNAELLTAVLRRNGHLTDAGVVDVRLTDLNTNGIGSTFQRAELSYSAGADHPPRRFVIKRPLLGDRGRGEADVYERVLRGVTGLPLLTCFGASSRASTRCSSAGSVTTTARC